jgi:hypothetical protein
MNDWTIMITLYTMVLFTEITHDPKERYNIGWLLIGVQGCAIVVSLVLVLVDSIKGCKQTYAQYK